MKLFFKTINVNTASAFETKEAMRLDEVIFDKNQQRTLQKFSKINNNSWIFVYGYVENSLQLLGKADITYYTINYSNRSIKRAKITNLGVIPFAIRKHIGSQLLKETLSECEKNGANYAYLNCVKPIENSKFDYTNFYLKNGFFPIKSIENVHFSTLAYPILMTSKTQIEADLNNVAKIAKSLEQKKK